MVFAWGPDTGGRRRNATPLSVELTSPPPVLAARNMALGRFHVRLRQVG
jgi:hypothetical protein